MSLGYLGSSSWKEYGTAVSRMSMHQMQRRRGILSLRDTIFVIHKKKMKDKVEFSNLENSTKFLVSATKNNSNEITCRQKKTKKESKNSK